MPTCFKNQISVQFANFFKVGDFQHIRCPVGLAPTLHDTQLSRIAPLTKSLKQTKISDSQAEINDNMARLMQTTDENMPHTSMQQSSRK